MEVVALKMRDKDVKSCCMAKKVEQKRLDKDNIADPHMNK